MAEIYIDSAASVKSPVKPAGTKKAGAEAAGRKVRQRARESVPGTDSWFFGLKGLVRAVCPESVPGTDSQVPIPERFRRFRMRSSIEDPASGAVTAWPMQRTSIGSWPPPEIASTGRCPAKGVSLAPRRDRRKPRGRAAGFRAGHTGNGAWHRFPVFACKGGFSCAAPRPAHRLRGRGNGAWHCFRSCAAPRPAQAARAGRRLRGCEHWTESVIVAIILGGR